MDSAMSKPLKMTFFIAGGLVVLLVFVAAGLFLFIDVDTYKPRLETAASEVLGLEVQVNGRLDFNLFPRPQLTLKKVLLAHQGAELGTIKEVRLGIGLIKLLGQQIDIRTLMLIEPKIFIERDMAGKFNLVRPETVGGNLPDLDVPLVALTGATLVLRDRQSGSSLEAQSCDLKDGQLQFPNYDSGSLWQTLAFSADIACGAIRIQNLTLSDVSFSVNGKHGVVDIEPVTMQVFGATGSGSLHADFSDAIPRYEVRYALPRFRIEEFFNLLTPEKFADGAMDFSAKLSMHGRTWNNVKSSAIGKMALQGENLKIHGRDLDQEFDRFESSQNFNLVDVAAIFIAGPFGLLVTKGNNFASILQGPGGESDIRYLNSEWQVEKGVAHARDVALATEKHRVALQGELDFVNETFSDVTVALIDAEGCTKVRQTIRGSFQQPEVEQPSVLRALTGPVRKLIQLGRDFFPGGECEKFYAGSVASPE